MSTSVGLPCTLKESFSVQFSSVQSLSRVLLFATPWTVARQASLSVTNSWSLLKRMFIELVMPSNHLILCHPPLFLPSIFPSIRDFSNESALHNRWPKYWSLSFNISLFNEYSGLISFRIDWFDLLTLQGTLKTLLQYHSSKASILWHSAFYIVDVHSCHLLFDHFQFALIHGPNIPGSYAILLFTASDLASIISHIHNQVWFLLWLHPFILSGVISPLISSSIFGTYRPGEFLFQYPIILPLHSVHGVLKARIQSGLPFPSPVDHILSDLSTMTRLSWLAPQGMA